MLRPATSLLSFHYIPPLYVLTYILFLSSIYLSLFYFSVCFLILFQDLRTVTGNIKINTRNTVWSVISHSYDMTLGPILFSGPPTAGSCLGETIYFGAPARADLLQIKKCAMH